MKRIEEVLTCEEYSPNSLAIVLKKAQIFRSISGDAILKWEFPGGRKNASGKSVYLKIEKEPGFYGRRWILREDFIKFYKELHE